MTETLIWLPVIMAATFGLLQACQIGVALVMVNYGAGSIARRASRSPDSGNQAISGPLRADYAKLMVAGMKSPGLQGCDYPSANQATKDLMVIAQAEVDAFPFMGEWLRRTPLANAAPAGCPSGPNLNVTPVSLTPNAPFRFIVRGTALARRNYR